MEFSFCAPSRRAVLAGAGALGALSLAGEAPAQGKSLRIDTHHHFFAPAWKAAEKAYADKFSHGYVFPGNANWTPEKTFEDMQRGIVDKAVLQLASINGIWFGAPDPAGLVHQCNEYGAELVQKYPGKFGLLAALPMVDVEASLKEIGYALDTIRADGIGLATSYGNRWPGDPSFDPIFQELNRRKALVYFHPTNPACCSQILPQLGGASVIEVPFDTTRCVASLLVSGTLARYRDIKWMFCHSGGSLPSLAGRIANFLSGGTVGANPQQIKAKLAQIAPEGVMAEFARLYFDTANGAWAPSMAALLKTVPLSHLTFGSDFPYFTAAQTRDQLMKLGLSRSALAAIFGGNALRLMPRLRAA